MCYYGEAFLRSHCPHATQLRKTPLFEALLELDLLQAYEIISGLCWVPDLLVVEVLVNRARRHSAV
jgi:hypothetical protein